MSEEPSAPSSAVAQSSGRPTTISGFLEKYKNQITNALPSHITPDRMIRLALTQINSNRMLKEATPESLFASIILAAQMGLEVGITGQGYLVPYKNRRKNTVECQFIPGWQGIVDLINRAGRATVWTGAVFQGDEFDWMLGDSPYVKHRPTGEDDPKKITHTYAIGRVRGSDWPVIEVWPVDKIIKHRNQYNKVGEDHYSYKSWEMYARKVPLLQVAKYMPKSVELSKALMAEQAAETGRGLVIDGDAVVLEQEPENTASSATRPANARDAAKAAAGRSEPPGTGGAGSKADQEWLGQFNGDPPPASEREPGQDG